MPSSSHASRNRHLAARTSAVRSPCRALLLIDNAPLQQAAWREFIHVRRTVEKVTRDLHRHEQTDTPAYEAWLHAEFPVLLTRLRALQAEVTGKEQEIEAVEMMALLTGRSPRALWREKKRHEAQPDPEPPGPGARARRSVFEPEGGASDEEEDAAGTAADDFFNDFFRRAMGDGEPHEHGSGGKATPPDSPDARDLYRRLVQHLHPDRGGVWNAARERLWHEVQKAWGARDADWLARLEIEWETANEQITPASALSRLRRAVEELHAARRDAERKLRPYRASPAWRFSVSEKKRPALHRRLEAELAHDLDLLQHQLSRLDTIIGGWEGGGNAGKNHRRRRSRQGRRFE